MFLTNSLEIFDKILGMCTDACGCQATATYIEMSVFKHVGGHSRDTELQNDMEKLEEVLNKMKRIVFKFDLEELEAFIYHLSIFSVAYLA